METVYFDNTVMKWLIALGVAVVAFGLFQLIKFFLANRVTKIAQRTATHVDDILIDALKRTHRLLLLVFSLYFGSLVLTLPEKVVSVIHAVATVAFFLQVALWGNAIITATFALLQKTKKEKDPASVSALTAISFLARVAVWSIVVFLILDNFGINITTLVAGLGIGGIAIALAIQNILSDIFCSVAILLDKPFEVGDFIVVGDMLGTVEKIGIKTTRVKSLSGEQLIFSNADLINSRIRNYKRMVERRAVFSFGVVYQTPAEKLEKIPSIVQDIIASIEMAKLDRIHFKEFGDSALNFECVYYVADRDYNLYMNIQQQINLELFRRFEKEGIEFAYPTQTLYIKKENEGGNGSEERK